MTVCHIVLLDFLGSVLWTHGLRTELGLDCLRTLMCEPQVRPLCSPRAGQRDTRWSNTLMCCWPAGKWGLWAEAALPSSLRLSFRAPPLHGLKTKVPFEVSLSLNLITHIVKQLLNHYQKNFVTANSIRILAKGAKMNKNMLLKYVKVWVNIPNVKRYSIIMI